MAGVDLSRRAFNKKVTFKTVAKTEDDSGGHGEVYTTLLTTRAAVYSKGGSRMLNEGTDHVVERKDIYVTYRAALSVVDKDTRITYEGRDYAIQAKNFIDEVKHIIKYEGVAV